MVVGSPGPYRQAVVSRQVGYAGSGMPMSPPRPYDGGVVFRDVPFYTQVAAAPRVQRGSSVGSLPSSPAPLDGHGAPNPAAGAGYIPGNGRALPPDRYWLCGRCGYSNREAGGRCGVCAAARVLHETTDAAARAAYSKEMPHGDGAHRSRDDAGSASSVPSLTKEALTSLAHDPARQEPTGPLLRAPPQTAGGASAAVHAHAVSAWERQRELATRRRAQMGQALGFDVEKAPYGSNNSSNNIIASRALPSAPSSAAASRVHTSAVGSGASHSDRSRGTGVGERQHGLQGSSIITIRGEDVAAARQPSRGESSMAGGRGGLGSRTGSLSLESTQCPTTRGGLGESRRSGLGSRGASAMISRRAVELLDMYQMNSDIMLSRRLVESEAGGAGDVGASTRGLVMDEAVMESLSDLPAELIRELKDSFNALDADGSGALTEAELVEALTLKYGSAAAEAYAATLMRVVDKDGGGTISYLEFMKQQLLEEGLLGGS